MQTINSIPNTLLNAIHTVINNSNHLLRITNQSYSSTGQMLNASIFIQGSETKETLNQTIMHLDNLSKTLQETLPNIKITELHNLETDMGYYTIIDHSNEDLIAQTIIMQLDFQMQITHNALYRY